MKIKFIEFINLKIIFIFFKFIIIVKKVFSYNPERMIKKIVYLFRFLKINIYEFNKYLYNIFSWLFEL
jgi:hypothetical protein